MTPEDLTKRLDEVTGRLHELAENLQATSSMAMWEIAVHIFKERDAIEAIREDAEKSRENTASLTNKSHTHGSG